MIWHCIECADFSPLAPTKDDKTARDARKLAGHGLGKCRHNRPHEGYAAALFPRSKDSCEYGLTPADAATVAKRREWLERQYGKEAQEPG